MMLSMLKSNIAATFPTQTVPLVPFNHSQIILHDSTNFTNLPNVNISPLNNNNDIIISGIDSEA
jgi:hypothetical protein